jgi:hypothetical protein
MAFWLYNKRWAGIAKFIETNQALMVRRDFLRNSLMALAVSLVPKVLQPVDPIENILTPQYYKVQVGDINYWTDAITWQNIADWNAQFNQQMFISYKDLL